MIDQEAARSAGKWRQEKQREREKLGPRGGRKAGTLRREDSEYWRGCRDRSAFVHLVYSRQ